jgi:hypothetical protein
MKYVFASCRLPVARLGRTSCQIYSMVCCAAGGNNLYLFVLAIAAMGMILITNLAALPTNITIPIFFLSILIDLVLVASSVILMA